MEEEEEICRVCRGEATLEEPLFHPCKCLGSIRFVHQKCLLDWLSHSKKKYCELCNYNYKFTPIYKSDMPAKIPTKIWIHHLTKWLYKLFILTLRSLLVLFIWLVFVPYITFWIWRFYFWNANIIRYFFVYCILGVSQLQDQPNLTVTNKGFMDKLLHDCLYGWLISSIVMIIFIAGFLLREWIIQNVPAELQDDELLESEEEDMILGQYEARGVQQEQNTLDTTLPLNEVPSETIRRARRRSSRRPLLLHEEPSDYENLEAMWLADIDQQHQSNTTSTTGQHFLNLEVEDVDNDDDDDDDDDGYFDESEEEVEINQPENTYNDIHPQEPLFRPNNEAVIFENNVANENDNIIREAAGPEDMDGILEAIGMKGSLFILFQNSGIIILLMCLGLGVGIWLPYILGVFFIILKPWEPPFITLTHTLHFFSTCLLEPFYDTWLVFYSQLDPISEWIPSWTPVWIRSIILTALHIAQSLVKFFSTLNITTKIDDDDKKFASLSSSNILLGPSSQSYTISLWRDIVSGWQYITPFFKDFLKSYSQMSNGVTTMDRTGCIITGYLILVFIGSFYLSKTNNMYARIGRTARQIIRHLGILLKVLFFITIELTLFPLGCGLLLDAVGLSLFYKIGSSSSSSSSSSTAGHLMAIHKRITFLKENTISSIFMHWAVGTSFMFLFTSMVTFCREIVRPGVIWFIRDPNDPQFNPIKELVERPFFTQLQKIGASAIIYGLVIELGVGGLVAAIGSIFDGILPLKWSYTQPLLTIPFDLLIVMIIIPALVNYFNPKKLLENLMVRWVTWLCQQLRLSSFLLGGRPVREEGYIYYKTWMAWIQRPGLNLTQGNNQGEEEEKEQEVTFIRTGQLVRVPNHDGVRFVPGRRMVVPVDPITLEAIDPQERLLGHPAARTREEESENTTVVYIPPQFKLRLTAFMIIIWVSWCALLCYIFVGPIAIGRWLFNYFGINAQPEKKIHDIYTYWFGCITIISTGFIAKKIRELVLHYSLINRQSLINSLLWIFNLCVITISFGILIPMIFGWILQLYIIIPFQNWGAKAPVINVFFLWSNGVVCLTLFYSLLSRLPENELYTSFIRIQNNGIKCFNFNREMKSSIGPILFYGLMTVFLPFIFVYAKIHILDKDNPLKQVNTLQMTFPSVLIGFIIYYLSYMATKFGKQWSQSVREDHYLINRVLHNIEIDSDILNSP
ncbi:uncharacterized protein BX663DRAFT_510560 [Cokeromyces recurvatus]|uniref:uncharacterized protein n=1 Tax=Cokeromyces recurvatus TaxID=90255 RepID=UPI00221FBD7A|nr:uncharacterized protein BX663DRAFT_510560 [Cokeromyces recurvatus]KAI7902809.1 hypothetical protein BX663DRAFT_510560 [Cokeromyces recurvatus]